MKIIKGDALAPGEVAQANKMLALLRRHHAANLVHEAYYDGSFVPDLVGISTPNEIAEKLRMVAGWPGIAVDVLEERLDFLAFADDDLAGAFDDNALDEESSQVHLDAMIYGIGFVSVTAGGDDEPDQVVRGHDAKDTTGLINPRTGRLDAALTREVADGEVTGMEIWTKDQIITAHREREESPWEVLDRTDHHLGRVPLVPFVNRSRTGNRGGKSEVSGPIRRYSDSAVRTLVSMDVNREFFSAPQRYALGMDQDDFVGPDGSPLSPWQILTGRVWMTPPVGDDEKDPQLGEFSPQPPGPYLDQIEGLAQLVAAEAGVPSHYLGLRGDQAASADAIRAMEARLVKRAERRQKSFGRSWSEVARLIRAGRDGVSAADVAPSKTRWGNPATPTIGATMDAMVKAVQVEVAPKNSRVVWDRVGFTPEEQKIMEAEFRRREAAGRAALLAGAAGRASSDAREQSGAANPLAPESSLDLFISGSDSSGL